MVYYTQAMVEHSILTMVGRKGTTMAETESTSVGIVLFYEIHTMVSNLNFSPSVLSLSP